MSDIELSVICRGCGSEVSPYVTECPYCGARVRKRAPELEHHDDHFEPKPPRRRRRPPRLPDLGRGRVATLELSSGATVGWVLIAVVVLLAGIAADLSLAGIGAVVGPLDGEWWRLVTAQFAFDNVGYLFAVAISLAIFGSGIERRIGSLPTAALLILTGLAATGAAYVLVTELGSEPVVIAGGNSVALAALAAWLAIRHGEARRGFASAEPPDLIGVGVIFCALLILPLVEASADVFAGLAGILCGGLAGLIVAGLRR